MRDATNWLDAQSPEKTESNIPELIKVYAQEKAISEQELIILKQMMAMFKDYNDNKLNLMELKGLLAFLSNPNSKVTLLSNRINPRNPFGGIFTKKMKLKKFLNVVLNSVKSKVAIDTKETIKPKYKKIFEKKPDKEEEVKKFSIQPQDMIKMRLRFAKREKTKSRIVSSQKKVIKRGRIINYTKEKNRENLRPLRTILNSIKNGNYNLTKQELNISENDFVYPVYESNVVYNIMLVLDTSKSVSWVIPHIEKFVSFITHSVSNSRDKLGLITFNNDIARIFHHPTLNVKQVIGTINKLKTKGTTPLGEGLSLARKIFMKEKYKLPGIKNMIILISDCYPEPLKGGFKDLLEEPCYKTVINAAKNIHKDKIGLVIINPAMKNNKTDSWSKKLIQQIKNVAKIKYIEVNPHIASSRNTRENKIIRQEELLEFAKAVNDVKVEL